MLLSWHPGQETIMQVIVALVAFLQLFLHHIWNCRHPMSLSQSLSRTEGGIYCNAHSKSVDWLLNHSNINSCCILYCIDMTSAGMSLSGSRTNLLKHNFLHESMTEKWNFKAARVKSDRKNRVLINFVGISMETGIRPEMWLAQFSKMVNSAKNELIMPSMCFAFLSLFQPKVNNFNGV